jgi:hypothetical protein
MFALSVYRGDAKCKPLFNLKQIRPKDDFVEMKQQRYNLRHAALRY